LSTKVLTVQAFLILFGPTIGVHLISLFTFSLSFKVICDIIINRITEKGDLADDKKNI